MNEIEVAERSDDTTAALHSLWTIQLDSNYLYYVKHLYGVIKRDFKKE